MATRLWFALFVLALAAYVLGLGGQYVPSNGDEMVYAHIARKTGESGHLLPLQSELPGTRNTKPPMLFWQAMATGAGHAGWTLQAMRTPSIMYLLLVCACMVAGLRAYTGRWLEAWRAVCLLLAFQSTFRFVRPYLTSAPETFWFSLPLLLLFWQRARDWPARLSGTAGPRPGLGLRSGLELGLGLGLGVGLLYKSYALVLPAAGAWWLALVASESTLQWRVLLRQSAWLAAASALALGLFALWPGLDPDPQGVWREFIIGENAGKFEDSGGWWREAFSLNGSSIWSQLLAYAVNAGLLFTVVLGLMVLGARVLWGWRLSGRLSGRVSGRTPVRASGGTPSPGWVQGWAGMPAPARVLVAWALVWALAFLLPSQRSARYVIPAMPAVAMLLALYWQRIARAWYLPALLACACVLVLLARVAWVAHGLALASDGAWLMTTLMAGGGLLAACAGVASARCTRGAAVAAALLVLVVFDLTVDPLDGPVGQYPAATVSTLPQGTVAVPNGFNGQFERFQFLLPGGRQFVPYETGGRALSHRVPGAPVPTPAEELDDLLRTHAAVVWIQPRADAPSPPCLPRCIVLGERWLMTSRHLPGEVRADNLWYPQDWLFRREWLLQAATP